MTLTNLITELQGIADRFGDCDVHIANTDTNILVGYAIDRICFFKDGEQQTVIIVER